MNSTKIKLGLAVIAVGVLFSGQGFAGNKDCPVGLLNDLTLDEEFGAGSGSATRCIEDRKSVKVVYQVNKPCKSDKCAKPYAVGNMQNAIKDYEITAGIKRDDYEMVAIVHSGGWPLILDNNVPDAPADVVQPAGGDYGHATENPFQKQVEDLIANGVKVYFCQNTARSKKVKYHQMIPGVEFVTAGVTAIADFQSQGFSYVQP